MPPPEPRSSTVSPGFKAAKSVGLPQPREAFNTASETSPACEESYRLLVMGSQQASSAADAPQQELPPAETRSAAWPYFSLTTSFMSVLICKPPKYVSI